ncbi:hypothetical protein T05_11048 [Trichinella murrelli]|uniref:Uncharacterized protein n=1 Tax=Trichinella murrelli TaxID=144512 RepID=A0A0V0SZB6_9BILA|nr:hypothetical protein T05_11048 [Trichinella murrelli]
MLRSSRTGRARRMTISIHHTTCYSTLTTSFLPPVDLQKGAISWSSSQNQWDLLDNFAVAKWRLETLERRMLRAIKMEHAFFHSCSYFENGSRMEVTSAGPNEQTWYLPHHIVSQQGPEAMKHRILVDGSVNHSTQDRSCRLTCWESCFDSGVFKWPFNLTSQVGVHEEDRDVCRFHRENYRPG